MSSTTSNLGLFKYDTTADSNVAFSITKALNNNWDKLDSTIPSLLAKKVNISSLVECHVVVEKSDESLLPSWYRVYSDGWCEQGYSGVTTVITSTVTFLKPFISNDYTLIALNHRNITSAWSNRFGYDKTTTGFTWVADLGVVHDWYACGYIE